MARQKMLKMRVDPQAIMWIGQTMNPINRYRYSPQQLPVYYALRLYERYAKVTGVKVYEEPPIALLNSMGIKVQRDERRYDSGWRIVGCRIDEYTSDQFMARGIQLDPLVAEHLRHSELIMNKDVEAMLKRYDEPVLVLPNCTVHIPLIAEGEGWVVL